MLVVSPVLTRSVTQHSICLNIYIYTVYVYIYTYIFMYVCVMHPVLYIFDTYMFIYMWLKCVVLLNCCITNEFFWFSVLFLFSCVYISMGSVVPKSSAQIKMLMELYPKFSRNKFC